MNFLEALIYKQLLNVIVKFFSLNSPCFFFFDAQDQTAGKMFADEAAAIYERAINSLMKKNMLIYFAYADFEEVCI